MKRGIFVFCIVSFASAIGAPLFLTPLTGKENQQNKREYEVVKVKKGSLQTHILETGKLQPIKTVEIKSQFSGEVAKLFVVSGEEVTLGQVLAVIKQEPKEARQVAQLGASIQEERINVDRVRRELMRMRSLFDKGYIAKKELEVADHDHQRALVRLELAERQLHMALGSNDDLYQKYLTHTLSKDRPEEFQIQSPTSGTILEVLVQPGEIITSGTSAVGGGIVLVRIADLSRMVVNTKINEVDIMRVMVGQVVDIQLDALPGQSFPGNVTTISTQGVEEDKITTYEVIIEISNSSSSSRLRPMLTAKVDILADKLENVLTVPLESLRTQNENDTIEVIVNGEPKKRNVQIAFRSESEAVVTQGVEEGEEIVIRSYTPRKHNTHH